MPDTPCRTGLQACSVNRPANRSMVLGPHLRQMTSAVHHAKLQIQQHCVSLACSQACQHVHAAHILILQSLARLVCCGHAQQTAEAQAKADGLTEVMLLLSQDVDKLL